MGGIDFSTRQRLPARSGQESSFANAIFLIVRLAPQLAPMFPHSTSVTGLGGLGKPRFEKHGGLSFFNLFTAAFLPIARRVKSGRTWFILPPRLSLLSP